MHYAPNIIYVKVKNDRLLFEADAIPIYVCAGSI